MINESSNFKTLVQLDLSKHLDKEYLPYIEDVIRLLILQISINFMFFIQNPCENSFFRYDFFELLLYIIVGLSVYWLIFKKFVRII